MLKKNTSKSIICQPNIAFMKKTLPISLTAALIEDSWILSHTRFRTESLGGMWLWMMRMKKILASHWYEEYLNSLFRQLWFFLCDITPKLDKREFLTG